MIIDDFINEDMNLVPITAKGVNMSALSPGMHNEIMLTRKINAGSKKTSMFQFISPNKVIDLHDVIDSKHVATSNPHAPKKADIVIKTGTKRVPVSIKQPDFMAWGNPGEFISLVKERFDDLVRTNKIQIEQSNDGFIRVPRPIAFEATAEEARSMVFGTDLQPNGFVLIGKFNSMTLDVAYNPKKNIVQIKSEAIIEDLQDIPQKYRIYFVIINSPNRSSSGLYPGLRAMAMPFYKLQKNTYIVR